MTELQRQLMQEIMGVKKTVEHESAYLSPKWILGFVAVIAVCAIAALCWLLADEYRQAQLRKRGYNKVPGVQMMGTQRVRT